MPTRQWPRQNHLLAALPAADYEQRLLPYLEPVPLPLGWAVYEADDAQGYVYFPTDSIVSLLYVMEDGASAEIAVVGNEAWWASPCSWAAKPPRAAQWCRARATAIGSEQAC